MSALYLYDGLEALCTMNELKTWTWGIIVLSSPRGLTQIRLLVLVSYTNLYIVPFAIVLV